MERNIRIQLRGTRMTTDLGRASYFDQLTIQSTEPRNCLLDVINHLHIKL